MNNKIFSTGYGDHVLIIIKADDKKEAIEKLKKELDYNETISNPSAEKDTKDWYKEMVKGIREITDDLRIKFISMFMYKESLIYFPYFHWGYENTRILKEYCEKFFDGKIVSTSEFNDIKEKLAQINKINGYEKLKNRIQKLAEYLKEDDFDAMV